jgi:hypothetical protein
MVNKARLDSQVKAEKMVENMKVSMLIKLFLRLLGMLEKKSSKKE